MIRTAICDDEANTRAYLAALIRAQPVAAASFPTWRRGSAGEPCAGALAEQVDSCYDRVSDWPAGLFGKQPPGREGEFTMAVKWILLDRETRWTRSSRPLIKPPQATMRTASPFLSIGICLSFFRHACLACPVGKVPVERSL